MARKDIETVLNDVETFLKANLNTRLTEIETEKGDGITLGPISSDAYFFQTMNNEVANFNPFIYYAVVGSTAITEGSPGYVVATEYELAVFLVSVDSENQNNLERQLLRWGRALKEIFEENWDKISGRDRFEVSSVEPFPFKLQASGEVHKAAGVSLKVTLA